MGLMVAAGTATPAAAAGTLVFGTGLLEGQLVGSKQYISPTYAPTAVQVELLIDGVVQVRQAVKDGPLLLEPAVAQNNLEVSVTVRAYDARGGGDEASTRVKVDTDPPEATFSPALTDIVHGPTTITATPVTDDLTEVVLYDTAGNVLGRRTEAPFTITWDATGKDGRLLVKLVDEAGNTASLQTQFQVDDQGPVVTSIEPAERALVRGATLNTTVAATDLSLPISAQLTGAAAPDTVPPYSATVPMGGDGARVLTWTLTDRWGNRSVTRRIVVVDNTLPTISITAPASGSQLSGIWTIPVRVADLNGIDRVEMRVNGRTKAIDTTSPFSVKLNTQIYGDTFTVVFYVFDKAGNVASTSPRTYRKL